MKRKLQILLAFVLVLSTVAVGGCGNAKTNASVEDYPTHQITLIVPFGAGGGTDLQARAFQKVAAKHLKKHLLVLNKPGGGGNLGLYEIAKSKPDGYTLGFSCSEVIFHSIYGTAKHHYLTALDPLAQISSVPFFLVVHADSPWNSVEELVEYGKTTPLKFSHGGIGSSSHVVGEIFGKLSNINTLQVPFKSNNEKIGMLLGKHVDATFTTSAAVKEHIKSGKLKILASTGPTRLKDTDLANVPTLKELGMDIELTVWHGIATSKPLPPEIKAKLVAELKNIILDPALKTELESLNAQVEYLGPEESQEKWIREADNFKKMVTETGVLDLIKQQQGVNPK